LEGGRRDAESATVQRATKQASGGDSVTLPPLRKKATPAPTPTAPPLVSDNGKNLGGNSGGDSSRGGLPGQTFGRHSEASVLQTGAKEGFSFKSLLQKFREKNGNL
jgi:hypothetical protein